MQRHGLFINGEECDAQGGATYPSINPANGAPWAEFAAASSVDIDRAVAAAKAAHESGVWRLTPPTERAAILRRIADLITDHHMDLVMTEIQDSGGTMRKGNGADIMGANMSFGQHAEFCEALELEQATQEFFPIEATSIVRKEPVGVVGCITPWNFPNAMLTRKVGPALATGCTVVCKPASATPLSALAMGELAERAGIPPGVINILAGNTAAIGAEITSNPVIRKLTFTGSTDVGKQLIEACAATVKRTSMELGGNAPFIVFDDADLDAAVTGAIASKYRNAGQTCVCANRMLVQASVYEAFAEKLAASVGALNVGNGMAPGVEIGPLIDDDAANDVMGMIEEATENGAQVLTGGQRLPLGERFIAPTVMVEVTEKMRVFKEEIFGPVAPLIKFETEDEAIRLANQTEFGLASYFYARDGGRIWRVAEGLEYGIVGINEGIISNEMAPFGGMKESGNGREGSKYGMDEYLEIKYLCMGGI